MIVEKLCATSGDQNVLVIDNLINIVVHDINDSDVRAVLGPILRR